MDCVCVNLPPALIPTACGPLSEPPLAPQLKPFGRFSEHCCALSSIFAYLSFFKDVLHEIHTFGMPETRVVVVFHLLLT